MSRPNSGITLAFDLHGVVADLASAMIHWKGGPPPYYEDLTSWEHPLMDGVWDVLKRGDLYRIMSPYPLVGLAVKGLYQSGYRIHLVTDSPDEARDHNLNWLSAWGVPIDEYHQLREKWQAPAQILLDDNTNNCEQFVSHTDHEGRDRYAVLVGRPWNEGGVDHPRVTRFPMVSDQWDNIVQHIRRLVNVYERVR